MDVQMVRVPVVVDGRSHQATVDWIKLILGGAAGTPERAELDVLAALVERY